MATGVKANMRSWTAADRLAALRLCPLFAGWPEAPLAEPRTPMWQIVEAAYHARGGRDPDLPGRSTVSGSGRVDLRFAEDADGELYVLSKSDGMIRKVVDVTLGPPPAPPGAALPAPAAPTTAR